MSDTTELRTSLDRRRRLVTRLEEASDGTVVWAGDGEGVRIDHALDRAAAQGLAKTFRRIDQVEIDVTAGGRAEATVRAVGHRLPLRRRVSVGAALGLARLGVPATVTVRTGRAA